MGRPLLWAPIPASLVHDVVPPASRTRVPLWPVARARSQQPSGRWLHATSGGSGNQAEVGRPVCGPTGPGRGLVTWKQEDPPRRRRGRGGELEWQTAGDIAAAPTHLLALCGLCASAAHRRGSEKPPRRARHAARVSDPGLRPGRPGRRTPGGRRHERLDRTRASWTRSATCGTSTTRPTRSSGSDRQARPSRRLHLNGLRGRQHGASDD